jgi:hypothetical protein
MKRWLDAYFEGYPNFVWKHECGGERFEKDFTIYLGSYGTMVHFVADLEFSDISRHLDTSASGESDRIVGSSGKCGARFDPRGATGRSDWVYGSRGIPFKQKEAHGLNLDLLKGPC